MKTISPPVLYYHSVAPKFFDGWPFKFLTHRLQDFEDQLIYLKDKRMKTVFLDRWLDIRQGRASARHDEVCLSFDDGFLDNWVYGFPLIKKYQMRFTLFVAPECIEAGETVRPTLENVWKGECQLEELEGRGFLTWAEVRKMQESGLVDIQSHTMSHDKYVSGPKISSFYYGGPNGVYPIWNTVPGIKATYMRDEQFTEHLPWGTPIFQEASAAIVRKHQINPQFLEETAATAREYDLSVEENRADYEGKVRTIHLEYLQKDQLINQVESEADYQKRLHYEVVDSKKIIESHLGKPVQFLCWPHGDNTPEGHQLARDNGYLATTSGKLTHLADQPDRIPRMGAVWRHGPWLNRQKIHYKLASHYRRQPFFAIWQLNEFKNQMLNRT